MLSAPPVILSKAKHLALPYLGSASAEILRLRLRLRSVVCPASLVAVEERPSLRTAVRPPCAATKHDNRAANKAYDAGQTTQDDDGVSAQDIEEWRSG